jgi:hypothetical protein
MRTERRSEREPARQLLSQWEAQRAERPQLPTSPLVSLSVTDAPLSVLLQELARQTSHPLAAAERYGSRPVTLHAKEQSLDDVLQVLARQLGGQVVRVGRFHVIADSTGDDYVLGVFRVRRLDQEQLRTLLSIGRGEQGRGNLVTPDGLVVIVDRLPALRRYIEAFEQIERIESATWAVQFYVVRLSDAHVRDLGFDVTPAVDLGAAAAAASASPLLTTATAAASLRATLRAVASDTRSDLVADPFYLLTDGETGETHSGDRVFFQDTQSEPSPGGPVSRTSLRPIDVGLSLVVTVRELSDDRCRLVVDLEQSRLADSSDNRPRIERESVLTTVDLVSGGTYLVAHRKEAENVMQDGTWLTLGSRRQRMRRTLQVWCSAYRIAVGQPSLGPVSLHPEPAAAAGEDEGDRIPAEAAGGGVTPPPPNPEPVVPGEFTVKDLPPLWGPGEEGMFP